MCDKSRNDSSSSLTVAKFGQLESWLYVSSSSWFGKRPSTRRAHSAARRRTVPVTAGSAARDSLRQTSSEVSQIMFSKDFSFSTTLGDGVKNLNRARRDWINMLKVNLFLRPLILCDNQ